MRKRAPLLLLLLLAPAAALSKTIEIRWPEVTDAAGYQLEVRSGERIVQSEKYGAEKRRARLELAPGEYRYRVRAIDAVDRPGQWSAFASLLALPPPPKLLSPGDGQTLPGGKALVIRWASVAGLKRFRLVVKREGREVYRDIVENDHFDYLPSEAGAHSVTVAALLGPHEGPPSAPRLFHAGAPPEAPATRVVATLRETAREPVPATIGEWLANNHGAIHLGSGMLPYHYQLDNGFSESRLDTSARAAEIVTGGEGWWNRHWGIGGFFDTRLFRIGGQTSDLHRMQTTFLYRRPLRGRWGLLVTRFGTSIRDVPEVWPDQSRSATAVQNLDTYAIFGPVLSVEWVRPLSRDWALSLYGEYFFALAVMEGEHRLQRDPIRYPNAELGLTGRYRLSEHFEASAAASYEVQQAQVSQKDPHGNPYNYQKIHLATWMLTLKLTRWF